MPTSGKLFTFDAGTLLILDRQWYPIHPKMEFGHSYLQMELFTVTSLCWMTADQRNPVLLCSCLDDGN
ncbi:hypothetical protein MUK42_12934 [Musa troglodytarum]|uniref:Uncharacterized protein n=1 Tax=Musa troglodytarum TaxID=320322 RepID=A0A9E7IK77_9LILI|nr:hypothetical protein MUK42_12934 [Musa troglodytarum]